VRKGFKEAENRMIGIRSPQLTADFGKLKKKNNNNNNKTTKKNTPEAEKNVLLKMMFFNLLFS
jgi:hypothetical protein